MPLPSKKKVVINPLIYLGFMYLDFEMGLTRSGILEMGTVRDERLRDRPGAGDESSAQTQSGPTGFSEE